MSFEHFCLSCPSYAPRGDRKAGKDENYWRDGECRKNAPYGQGNLFPQVDETDWCADHPENTLPGGMVVMEPEDPNNCVKVEWREYCDFR